MLLKRKKDEIETGEKLTVRVTFSPAVAGEVRRYAAEAGYGEDYAALLAAAVEYVLAADPDFRGREKEKGKRGRKAAVEQAQTTAENVTETQSETAPEQPTAAVEQAQTTTETQSETVDPLPRRGLFGRLS